MCGSLHSSTSLIRKPKCFLYLQRSTIAYTQMPQKANGMLEQGSYYKVNAIRFQQIMIFPFFKLKTIMILKSKEELGRKQSFGLRLIAEQTNLDQTQETQVIKRFLLVWSIFIQTVLAFFQQKNIVMSGKRSVSNRSLSNNSLQFQTQSNQQPQPDPMFEEGRAIFQKFQKYRIQEIAKFTNLNVEQMQEEINCLSFWIELGGPKDKIQITKSKIFLQMMEKTHQQLLNRSKARRRIKVPGIFTAINHFIQSKVCFGSQKQKYLANQPGSKPYDGLELSSQQRHRMLHKRSEIEREVEFEENSPLKQQ